MKTTARLQLVFLVVGLVVWVIAAIMVDPHVEDTAEANPPPADEAARIERIQKLAIWTIENGRKPDKFFKRDAHLAPHGCVKAHFRVQPELPERYRHGVFQQPGHVYEAWVRFSNGLFADDTMRDARGMAIKLMGVPGKKLLGGEQADYQTQDFVMINNATFPIADLAEFERFFQLQIEGNTLGYFIGGNPFEWHLREMRVGFGMLERGASPLSMSYFSMVPYKLGPDENIKFSALACDPEITDRCVEWEEPVPDVLTPTYLRDAMVAQLTPVPEDGPDAVAARFAFRVQLQVEGASMPIENASIEWSELISPYVPIAELTIPPQRFNSEAQNVFCENLSFAPWHALPAHRPIGGLNRARRIVYNRISELRHKGNGVPRYEPLGFCLHLDGKPCDQGEALP